MSNDFAGFGLPTKLLHALTKIGFTTPTPVQAQAIPLALQGKDVLATAQTGTGKTGAFGIPLVAQLIANPGMTALVMTPTRELATQVAEAIYTMCAGSDIKSALLIGGEPISRQFHQLQRRPRLIVGTPGRINDHIDRGSLKLNSVGFVVLDEADRMLDMGFGVQIEQIFKHVSKQRQTLMFSATLPANIVKLSSKYLDNPSRITVGSTTTPATKIQQELIHTTDGEKYSRLLEQLEQRTGSIIIFVKTKFGTERLASKLNREDHKADAIHGDLQQRKRDRVIQSFRQKEYRILVATDVAARGLDIPHIEHVINYDLPQCPEDYIHRIGRTARAGAEGKAVNLVTSADGAKWRAIHKLMHGVAPTGMPGGSEDRSQNRRGRSGKPSYGKGGGPKKKWTPTGSKKGTAPGGRSGGAKARNATR